MPTPRSLLSEWRSETATAPVDRPVAPSYFLVLLAGTLAATFIVDEALLTTMAALFLIWLVASLVLRPGYHLAGAGAVAALTVALIARNYSELEPAGRVWVVVVLIILSTPYLFQPLRNSSGFPFLHFWCLIQGIYVYVSGFFGRPSLTYAPTFPNEIRTTGFRTLALFTAILVTAGMLASVLLRMRTTKSRREAPEVLSSRAISRAYVLMIAGAALLFITFFGGVYQSLGSIAAAIRLLAFGGWLVLVYAWMDGNLTLRHKIVVMVAPVGWVLATLGDSALYQASYPGFFVLGLWIARRRSIPWLPILAALIVLIVMNTGKSDFRNDLHTGQLTGSTTELGVTWIDQTRSSLGETTEDQLTASAWRFSNSDLLGYITTWVPDRYPYFGYQAYSSLPLVLVPRVVMPDKPAFNLENQFGRDYELIARSDFVTTVNTPLHVEAMVAGGPIVLIIVAIASGLYFALLGRVFASRSPASLITASLVGLQVVLSAESGTLAMILILPFSLFLFPVLWWTTTGGGRDRPTTEDPRPAIRHATLPEPYPSRAGPDATEIDPEQAATQIDRSPSS